MSQSEVFSVALQILAKPHKVRDAAFDAAAVEPEGKRGQISEGTGPEIFANALLVRLNVRPRLKIVSCEEGGVNPRADCTPLSCA
jgi:hypothetical protein